MRRGRGVGVVGLLVVLAVLLPAAPASAHDYLVGSTPAAGATVASAPSSVSLRFDDTLLAGPRGSTALLVTSAAGRHFETSCARIDDRTLTASVRLGPPGRYTATWRVVSADGHPVSASISFTTRAAGGSAGTAGGPDCGVKVSAAAPAAGNGSLGWVIGGIAGGVGLLVIVAGVVLFALRPRRAPSSR